MSRSWVIVLWLPLWATSHLSVSLLFLADLLGHVVVHLWCWTFVCVLDQDVIVDDHIFASLSLVFLPLDCALHSRFAADRICFFIVVGAGSRVLVHWFPLLLADHADFGAGVRSDGALDVI